MKAFPIPVVALGAGSQPEEDEELQYLPMPDSMMIFELPIGKVEADAPGMPATCKVIERLREQMKATSFDIGEDGMPSVELLGMDTDVVRLLNQTLGEGEVSILVRGNIAYRIQETVFASVWRVREYAADTSMKSDKIVACAIPPIAKQWALQGATLACKIPEKTGGVMNAPAVLSEILDKATSFQAGDAAYVINLTLLPMSPEDIDCLIQSLGVGTVTILSRGYGNCRISSTALRNVWWVQYFNSMDTLILNTIEVSEMPDVAQASREDYEDSIERLSEWLQVMQEPESAVV